MNKRLLDAILNHDGLSVKQKLFALDVAFAYGKRGALALNPNDYELDGNTLEDDARHMMDMLAFSGVLTLIANETVRQTAGVHVHARLRKIYGLADIQAPCYIPQMHNE